MDEFVELLRESVIFQGILTLSCVGVWLYMMVTQMPIPPELHAAVGLVLGFFFGSKVQNKIQKVGLQKQKT